MNRVEEALFNGTLSQLEDQLDLEENEYRCTRQRFGKPEDCQGHYLNAKDQNDALAKMAKKFPEDVKEGYWFSATFWKKRPVL